MAQPIVAALPFVDLGSSSCNARPGHTFWHRAAKGAAGASVAGPLATVVAKRTQLVGGSKGGGQGEYAPAKHVLDSEPGSRVKGAGAYTATCAVTRPRREPYAGKPHVRIWAGGV